ncbi:MAG: YcxB family protein [Goleter apudmare HA4340-LM2]|nr:YcxB family protein [Goleter apudmare HA4340-LM2]
MRFEYRLNINDLKEANQAHSKKFLWKYYLFMILTVLLASILPLLKQGSITINEMLLSVIVPNLLFFAFLYLGVRISQKFMINRAWKNQPGVKTAINVETTEEGLQIKTDLSESKLNWSLYTHWQETPNLFMLYQSLNIFNLFPKRAFSSEAEMNEFRELLKIKLLQK